MSWNLKSIQQKCQSKLKITLATSTVVYHNHIALKQHFYQYFYRKVTILKKFQFQISLMSAA